MFLCRGCGSPLHGEDVFADLGAAPLANALLTEDNFDQAETHYRLLALVCRDCLLVQVPAVVDPKLLFDDAYPFYSGQSAAWRDHCLTFAGLARERLGLSGSSRVLEIGSNDGTMLHGFRESNIPAMGVEPCRGVAQHALRAGLATDIAFWSQQYAQELRAAGYQADLLIASNVLAHVPDLQDFLCGVALVLAPKGQAIFEVPYVGNLLAEGQWDQIYHEHHCYFGVHSLQCALQKAGLHLTDVEPISIHGGSLRAFVSPGAGAGYYVLDGEPTDLETYRAFAERPTKDKLRILKQLTKWAPGGRVVGYGASAKAATLLHYCGIGPEWLEFVVDTTPAKQGKWLPGSRIPVVAPHRLAEAQPEVVVNFCWNWPEESERNIRAACPDAQILYLHEPAKVAM